MLWAKELQKPCHWHIECEIMELGLHNYWLTYKQYNCNAAVCLQAAQIVAICVIMGSFHAPVCSVSHAIMHQCCYFCESKTE